MNNSNKNTVPAVDRAIDVIELVASSKKEMSLSDVLENVDIPRQSLIRILNTLCRRDFLNKSGTRGRYRLGLKFLYWNGLVRNPVSPSGSPGFWTQIVFIVVFVLYYLGVLRSSFRIES